MSASASGTGRHVKPEANNAPRRAPWDAILGLGSNIGDKAGNIAAAIAMLTEAGDIRLVARSRDYRSAPWGVVDQDWFVNACVSVATRLAPRELLARCQDVEQRLGRVRLRHWGPRIIDVDILFYRDAVIDEPGLIVPHPRIAERAFVLRPLEDIAPDLRLAGRTPAELLASLAQTGHGGDDVVPFDAT